MASKGGNLSSLAERKILDAQEATRLIEAASPEHHPWPIICISRQMGTEAHAVADAVADQLHFTVWGRELVQAVAERMGCSASLVDLLDERPRHAIVDWLGELLNGTQGTEQQFVDELRTLLGGISQMGAAVVVGHAARMVAPAEACFAVRLVGQEDARLARYQLESGLAPREALRRMRTLDRDHDRFVTRYFPHPERDPTTFDLTVDVPALGADAAAAAVVAAYRQRFPEGEHPPVRG